MNVVRRLKDPGATTVDIADAEVALNNRQDRRELFGNRVARGKLYSMFLAKGTVRGAVWDDGGECRVPRDIADSRGHLVIELRTRDGAVPVELGAGGFGRTVSTLLHGELLALKISASLEEAADEARILSFLTRTLLDGTATPGVARYHFSFLCPGGPPLVELPPLVEPPPMPVVGPWGRVMEASLIEVPEDPADDPLEEALGFKDWTGRGTWTRENVKGVFFIGLEEGATDLAHYLRARRSLPVADRQSYLGPRQVASLSFQVMFSLAAMHRVEVLHRDIQTGNLIVARGPAPRRLYRYRSTHYEPVGPEIRFIDFGVSAAKDIERKYVEYSTGLTKYRAPEFFFVETAMDRRAPPEVRKGLQTREGFRYGPEADVFSAGLVVLTIAWEEPIFWLSETNLMETIYPHPTDAFLDEVADERAKLLRLRRPTGARRRALHFTYMDDPQNTAYYLWSLVHLLGMPTERDWPGITSDPLYKLLVRHRATMHPIADAGGWVRSDFLASRLGIAGQAMVQRMLSWNPDRRGRAADHLASPYFAELADRGAIARYVDGITPAWSFDPGDFERPDPINCKKRSGMYY